jgi:hypothetical protein
MEIQQPRKERVMKRFNKAIYLTAALMTLALASCVYSPYDGQSVTTHNPLSFKGFASQPDSQVKIFAFNKSTSHWDLMGSTLSSSSPVNYGGDTLYHWSTSVDMGALSNWKCYWVGTCRFPHEGTYKAEFKVQQEGGQYLTSFEKDGVSCVMDKVGDGKGWLESGFECKSGNSPIINLLMHIVW